KPGISTVAIDGTLPKGTAQELARQILNNPNISFQVEPTQRQAMEYIAQTGHARDCGGPAVDPKILSVLLAAAQKHKIVVGVVVDGHLCDGLNHPKGWAVDLNGINPLTGSGGTNRNITLANFQNQPIVRQFYTDMANWLAQAGGGRLGQISCFQGAPPPNVAGVRFISDACTHLHIDIET
ncbi:MAG: hypothetical protein AAB834_04580, partial [Patescibacteria group bacterium]